MFKVKVYLQDEFRTGDLTTTAKKIVGQSCNLLGIDVSTVKLANISTFDKSFVVKSATTAIGIDLAGDTRVKTIEAIQ